MYLTSVTGAKPSTFYEKHGYLKAKLKRKTKVTGIAVNIDLKYNERQPVGLSYFYYLSPFLFSSICWNIFCVTFTVAHPRVKVFFIRYKRYF